MSRVRRATVDDFYAVLDVGANEPTRLQERSMQATIALFLQGESFAVETDTGVLLAVVGGREIWAGVAEVWALVSRHAGAYALALHRGVKRLLGRAISARGLRRIEINVLRREPRFIAWARRLGFRLVGTRRCFGPNGEDFLLFAWVAPA